jgi:hypothetical protein
MQVDDKSTILRSTARVAEYFTATATNEAAEQFCFRRHRGVRERETFSASLSNATALGRPNHALLRRNFWPMMTPPDDRSIVCSFAHNAAKIGLVAKTL